MYKLKLTYYKPRYSGIAMSELDGQEDIVTQVTTITKSSLKRGYKNIPVMPKLHADAIVELGKHNIRYLLSVAMYISLHLKKDTPETVSLRMSNIQEELGLSEPSIIKAIKTLEELKYLRNIGKSLYYISPRLAFYGSAIEWSLALQIEARGGSLEEFREARQKINEQIKHNELSVGVIN